MRSSTLLAILFAALGPTACGSCDDKPKDNTSTDSGSAAVTTDAAPATSASATLGKRNMGMRGAPGPVGMITGAARSLELKDDQKAKLDAAEKSLKGDDASSRDEMKALHTDLAASVKAGKIDQAKVDADLAALEKAAKDRNDKEAAALNDVYAALEPAQRTQVVAKVRERTEKREKQMSERMAKMAERMDGGAGDGGARGGWGSEFTAQKRMEHLTNGLDLDAEQQKKAQAAAKDDPKAPTMETARADAKKRGEALLAAFEKDGFDAKKLEAPDAKRARQGADQEVKLLAALLPILKPEQREKLATRMEKQAQGHGGPGGPGGPHGGMMGGPGGPGGFGGPGGRGGPGGHRRSMGRHGNQAMGPDYDWFDDDEEEESTGGGGGGGGGGGAGGAASGGAGGSAPSAAPSAAGSAK